LALHHQYQFLCARDAFLFPLRDESYITAANTCFFSHRKTKTKKQLARTTVGQAKLERIASTDVSPHGLIARQWSKQEMSKLKTPLERISL
jgi:hypothetical protein